MIGRLRLRQLSATVVCGRAAEAVGTMATENETSVWGVVVGTALIALCCAGPLIVVAVGPALLLAAARLDPYRPYLLLAASAVLSALGVYSLRRRRAHSCGEPGHSSRSLSADPRVVFLLCAGAVLALLGALMATLGRS